MFPHITDDEFKNLAGVIEDCYASHLPPHAQPVPTGRLTHVDQTGYGRWTTDYLTARARGYDHEGAIRVMHEALHAAGGVTPVPVPPPATDRIIGGLRIEGSAFVDSGE